ncbi:cholinesterase-like isoform X1 [Haliotis asinina]|uniref:cholinesterase-like isoform X1 n=1 Tax=Haliotis asinina TaxID=109174 RepID=UPI00353238DF
MTIGLDKGSFGALTLSVILISVIELACGYSYSGDYVTTDTVYGKVKGVRVKSSLGTKYNWRINMFLGIPYAKRIEQYQDWRREFRFKNAEPPSWYGIWDATYHRPACPQQLWLLRETLPEYSETSEDCLYLNIYTPDKIDDFGGTNLYPVLVFIHGGGWTMGSGQQYPGMFLADRSVVVVTFNYRLNALGFLSTGDQHAPGNYGMWDQIRALEFVKRTISSFRGNPNLVTIMGQSVGAVSVGLHLLSPRTGNLFHRAIMMSGSDLSEWAIIPSDDAKKYSKALGYEVGCPTNDNQRLIECLRMYRSYNEIVNASARVMMKPGKVGNPWGPVVDGQVLGVDYSFLPDPPSTIRKQGRFKKMQVLAGLVLDEGSFFIPNLQNLLDGVTPAQFDNILKEFLRDRGIVDMSNAIDALSYEYTYWPEPKNYSQVRQMLTDLMSDYMFGTGINEMLRSQVIFNTTYFYVFKYKSWNDYLPPWRGVAHGQDLQYVFGLPYFNETYVNMTGLRPRQEYDLNDRNISEYMINMFTNFTARGDPTPRDRPIKDFRNATWLGYNPTNHSYLSITNKSENLTNFRQKQYAFWTEYFPKVSGRDLFAFGTTQSPETEKTSPYEISTWALVAGGALMIIIIIAVCIVLARKTRTKNYETKYRPARTRETDRYDKHGYRGSTNSKLSSMTNVSRC